MLGGVMSAKDDITFHYIIVRGDLAKGDNDAQIGHAAGYSASMYTKEKGEVLPEHTHVIVLEAPDEKELVGVALTLSANNVPFFAVKEPDPPFNGAWTAIGVIPAPRKVLAPYLSRLPITKERPCPKCAGIAAAQLAVRRNGENQTGNDTNGT